MDKLDLLRKIKALAEQGEGGEKINAEKMLADLMRKHSISEGDLNAEQSKTVWFKTFGQRSAGLLYQIVAKVGGQRRPDAWAQTKTVGLLKKSKRQVPNLVGFQLTPAQAVEVEYLFDFFWKLYQQEEDLLFRAFIHKHDLFGKIPAHVEVTPLSESELKKLRQAVKNLDEASPYKQIMGRVTDG